MAKLLANNAFSTLTAPVAAGDLVINIVAADAGKFPAPGVGDDFTVTLIRKNTGEVEIVKCTARAAGALTVVRAQEGTAALTFIAGDIVSMRFTKGVLDAYIQQATAAAALNGVHLLPNGAPLVSTDTMLVDRAGVALRVSPDDVTAYGPQWNGIHNPGMAVTQRGVGPVALTTSIAYLVDMWGAMQSGVANGTVQQGGSIKAGYANSIKIARNAGANQLGILILGQAMETMDAIRYQGKTVTFSFTAKAGANYSAAGGNLSVQIFSGTGTDQTLQQLNGLAWAGQVAISVTNQPITAVATEYSVTLVVPANATQLGFLFVETPTGVAGADDSFAITDVKWQIGGKAAPAIMRSYQQERAICRRFLPAMNFTGINGEPFGAGDAQSATSATIFIPFDVQARVAPTGFTLRSGIASNVRVDNAAGSTVLCTAVAFQTSGRQGGQIIVTTAGGLVAGSGVRGWCGAADDMFFTGAEL